MYLLIGVLFIIGINLAGSEGGWFPTVNFGGVVCLFVSLFLILRKERENGEV